MLTLDEIELKSGNHEKPEDGMCVMEAVAYFAGLPFSDEPECVCPTLRSFLVSWNDSMKDEDRQKLKPYVLKVVGTNHGPEVALARSYMVADWFVRVYTPAWLDLAKLTDHAEALRALPEIKDKASAKASEAAIGKANKAAYAARAAAWDALAPTSLALQQSAFDLLDRMIALTTTEQP